MVVMMYSFDMVRDFYGCVVKWKSSCHGTTPPQQIQPHGVEIDVEEED